LGLGFPPKQIVQIIRKTSNDYTPSFNAFPREGVFSLHKKINYVILTAMINIELTKNNNENNLGLIRRFSKKVKSSGIIARVRSIRYHQRDESKYTRKKRTLKSITRKAEIDQMIKMGKAPAKK
jgi:ribosomal protein S21